MIVNNLPMHASCGFSPTLQPLHIKGQSASSIKLYTNTRSHYDTKTQTSVNGWAQSCTCHTILIVRSIIQHTYVGTQSILGARCGLVVLLHTGIVHRQEI